MTATINIPIGKINPSPSNPRKSFPKQTIEQLAASIVAVGLQSPIKVRMLEKGTYELVAGERRWRAYQHAKLPEIPAFVEELTDEQVIEIQLVENTQREDVPPLEEAEAYAALMTLHGYTMERLIEKTGKSKTHLYARIALTKASPAVKKALAGGKISSVVGELISRLPVAKLQDEFLLYAIGTSAGDAYNREDELGEHGIQQEGIALDEKNRHRHDPQPLSYRACQKLFASKFATRLDSAPFDPKDAELVLAVGACTGCAFRSTNTPELFPDIAKADVCTNTKCFEGKIAATWKLREKEAKERGLEVLDPKESAEDANGTNAKYVDPKQEISWYDVRDQNVIGKTWEKLLGKKHELPTVLARDERGAPVEMIDKKAAIAALKESGKLATENKASSSSPSTAATDKKEREKEAAKKELLAAAFARALGAIAEATEKVDLSGGKKLVPLIRWIAARVMSMVDGQTMLEPLNRVSLRRGNAAADDASAKLGKILEKGTGAEVLGLMVELLASESEGAIALGWGSDKEKKDAFEELLELLGVDWKKQLELAKDALATEAKLDKAATDAKKAKKSRAV